MSKRDAGAASVEADDDGKAKAAKAAVASATVTVVERPDGWQMNGDASLPGLVRCDAGSVPASVAWARASAARLDALLVRHGAVMLRGFGLRTAADFRAFIEAFGCDFQMTAHIGGGGPRNQVDGPVHTSTESPREFFIPYHHELAYISNPPSRLFFFAERPAAADGETPVLLSSRLVDAIERERPAFIAAIERLGVRYVRTLEDRASSSRQYQRSWQEVFATDDRAEAERRAASCGTEKVEWLQQLQPATSAESAAAAAAAVWSMRCTTQRFEGVRVDPRTNTRAFFNAIVLLHPSAHRDAHGAGGDNARRLWDATYGDGSTIADDDVLAAKRIMREQGTMVAYERGDVLVVDNMLALHARNSFADPQRRILAAMVR